MHHRHMLRYAFLTPGHAHPCWQATIMLVTIQNQTWCKLGFRVGVFTLLCRGAAACKVWQKAAAGNFKVAICAIHRQGVWHVHMPQENKSSDVWEAWISNMENIMPGFNVQPILLALTFSGSDCLTNCKHRHMFCQCVIGHEVALNCD